MGLAALQNQPEQAAWAARVALEDQAAPVVSETPEAELAPERALSRLRERWVAAQIKWAAATSVAVLIWVPAAAAALASLAAAVPAAAAAAIFLRQVAREAAAAWEAAGSVVAVAPVVARVEAVEAVVAAAEVAGDETH